MSKETANKFFKSLESNSLLKSKFDDLLNNISGLTKEEQAEKIIEFAKKQGYEIDKSDVKDNVFSVNSGELSEDELLNVAGGVAKWCWWSSITKPKLQKNQKAYLCNDGGYRIDTMYLDGIVETTYYNANGEEEGTVLGKQM